MAITVPAPLWPDHGVRPYPDEEAVQHRPDNVVPFPLNRRPVMSGCPQCGSRTALWPIGRLVWGYCIEHELRWVAADLKTAQTDQLDRGQMRRGLEFLARFVEVSH